MKNLISIEEVDREAIEAILDRADSFAEVGRRYGESVMVPQLVGTPAEIADQLQALFTAEACDGFVVTPAHLPHGFDAFVDLVVPELQARGLFRERYRGTTLREQLLD